MTFRHGIPYMGNLFVVSLDINVTINTLQKIIKNYARKDAEGNKFTLIP